MFDLNVAQNFDLLTDDKDSTKTEITPISTNIHATPAEKRLTLKSNLTFN